MKQALRAALVVAGVVAIWLAVRNMSSVSRAIAASAPVTSSSAALGTPERTRLAILKDLLGEKWPLIEVKLTPEQLASLSEPGLPGEFLPWTDVEQLIRTQIRDGFQNNRDGWIHNFRDKGWPKDLTLPPLNPTSKQLGPEDLEHIQNIVDEFNSELEPLAALAFDLLVEAEEGIWDQRLYEAYPFIDTSLAGAKQRVAQFTILEKWKNGVWTVSYVIDSSEWPTLDAVLTEMAEIAARRHRVVAAYVESL